MRLTAPTLAELPGEAIVTAQDVARWLGVSVRTVQRAGVPAVVIAPRTRRYRVQDVREWIAAHVQGAA